MSTALDWINRWAKKKPSKAALIYRGTALSYSHLAHAVEAARRFLASQLAPVDDGAEDRPTAVLVTPSLVDAWVLTLAARSLGMDTLSLPRSAHELIDAVKPLACVLVMEADAAEMRLTPGFRQSDKLVVVPDVIFFPPRMQAIKGLSSGVTRPGGNFLMSSGATGAPKRVLVSAHIESEVAEVYAKHAMLTASSRAYLTDYSLAASGGYKYGLACFKLGATIIIDRKVDFLTTFYEADFDTAKLRPSHIDALFDAAPLQPPVLKPRLRLHFGGGFMNFRKIEWVLKNITPNVFLGYGATENGAVTKTKIVNADDLLWQSVRPHRRIEIVDESGAPVPDGVEGVLRIRQESFTAQGYHQDPEATAVLFRDGFFYPGDLAMRRADGRVRILGRVSDVLFINGDRFPVGPVEQDIQQIAGCLDACVFARQNARTHTEILIALEAAQAPGKEQMDRMKALFGTAEAVHVSACAAFPKTAGGKTDRAALRARLLAERDAQGAGAP